MIKTLIVLPDGTELSSGVGMANAIQSVTITECVNGAQELTLGSACASMIEARLLTPEGGLSLEAGQELTVYRVGEDGVRHQVGLFTTEKPTRSSANTLTITAYDRVSWLDKDLTQWLAGLAEWPYSLYKLAQMVCAECGLALQDSQIPNGDYLVKRFSADGITGRQLIQWIGEAAGRFCRATPEGLVAFDWYSPGAFRVSASAEATAVCTAGALKISAPPNSVVYGDESVSIVSEDLSAAVDGGNGSINAPASYYYQNGLSFEDYEVAPIEKVQIRQTGEDIGTVYPDDPRAVNTYIISGNYLLSPENGEELKPVAQALYEQLRTVSYTPCRIVIPTTTGVRAGDVIQITDINGRCITAYVMTKKTVGQRDTLECTGSYKRTSSTAVNSRTFQALHGKMLNLRTDVDGIRAENKDAQGQLAALQMDVRGISSEVAKVEGLDTRLTQVEQKADSVQISVQSICQEGVSKVKTEFGLTVEDSKVSIHKSGAEMTNQLTESGMYVIRNADTELATTMLQADADGVIATDVKVRNYLAVGNHARFEDYNDGTDRKRTACFWLDLTAGG